MTQGEEDFVEQYARVLLVEWCCQQLTTGHITSTRCADGPDPRSEAVAKLCLDFALTKGWVGKSEPKKVLAKGFSTAAAFLKR